MNYLKVASLAALGAIGLAAQASALTLGPGDSTTLDQLNGTSTTIVEGDKTFSAFTYTGTIDASEIQVSRPSTGFGLVFTASWDTNSATVLDAALAYNVTVANGNSINSTGLDLGVAQVNGGTASVGEDIVDHSNGDKNYHLQVFTDGTGGAPDNLSDTKAIAPASTSLSVVKDLTVTKDAGADSRVQVTFFDNTFTQTNGGNPPPIPEPMSLALIPLAIVGLGLRKMASR